jgi:hypothetical protein
MEVILKKQSNGYPILPSLEEIEGHLLIYKKKLIGKFMSDVYSASVANRCF